MISEEITVRINANKKHARFKSQALVIRRIKSMLLFQIKQNQSRINQNKRKKKGEIGRPSSRYRQGDRSGRRRTGGGPRGAS